MVSLQTSHQVHCRLRLLIAVAIGLFGLTIPMQARAAAIIYTLNYPLGYDIGFGTGQLTGTITTDGTIGPLAISDISSWDLTIAVGGLSAAIDSDISYVTDQPVAPPCGPCSVAPLSATSTQLFFDFSECGSGADPCMLNFENTDESAFVVLTASLTSFPNDGIIVDGITVPCPSSCIVAAEQFPLTGPQVIATVVPEPATWAVMLLGFGGVGWMMRTNRKQTASVMG